MCFFFSDFKFSTQFVFTVLVTFIAVFEVCSIILQICDSEVSLQSLEQVDIFGPTLFMRGYPGFCILIASP